MNSLHGMVDTRVAQCACSSFGSDTSEPCSMATDTQG